eukprot:CAMPEP_0201479040 /NCGR_PEP_ID=MMETSP0151_2-20130828/3781_1 /ASSEMBLY_ACC=CAM_ASM_000257 /TAXON_ID=200890 /ORGANISM="Paramoeba atlantica, Strain 621/1 / CCAP 1560/9" /LENGTH=570 /DNA_ID=CAMNT_0047860359 /DNA_START=27 /DNA_END=1739 /DNA_ORIENTATION=-
MEEKTTRRVASILGHLNSPEFNPLSNPLVSPTSSSSSSTLISREEVKDREIDKITNYGPKIDRMVTRWSGNRTQSSSSSSSNRHHASQLLFSRDENSPPSSSSSSSSLSSSTPSEYVEKPRSLPVYCSCEVLVVGGGPSGLAAAIGAARAGAHTLLVERFGCFGGVVTTVGMETLGWYRYEGTVDCEGIGREFERRAEAMEGGSVKFPCNDSPCLDADHFKVIADQLVRENGIHPLLHTFVVDAIMEDNKIKGVIIENKTGRQAIFAKCVVDCTGDADVSHFAGARYWRVPKELNMGVTTVFGCAGVDKEKFLRYVKENPATYQDWSEGSAWPQATSGKENHLGSPYLASQFEEAQKEGIIPKENSKNVSIGGSWSSLTSAGEATNLNLVHMSSVDCTNADHLTAAEMEGRKQTLHALRALKEKIPGFENAKLRTFSMTLGCRDSRKIFGRHNLTKDDVSGQARFSDSIGIFPEFIDGYRILILPTTGRYFQVPYGCLVPVDVDNLLVGGRAVAGDMASHSAMRNMMACTVTGQGAGVAAAISVKTNQTTHQLQIDKVQAELKRQGVRLF